MKTLYELPCLSEGTFKALAHERGAPINTRAEACSFEGVLRREGFGRVPHNQLRIWYRDHGMAHGRTLTIADFRPKHIDVLPIETEGQAGVTH